MQTSSRSYLRQGALALGIAAGAMLAVDGARAQTAGAAAEQYTSAWAAYNHGINSYKGGYYEFAVPALEHAAKKDVFPARFYLARIFADSRSAHTDHAKAYVLFRKIVDEFADVDPDLDRRAPFVAKSLLALAGYVRSGLSDIGLQADSRGAAKYIQHAATYFNDEDAQFELAKLYLDGDGVPKDIAMGTHWLSVLTQKGHAGAQAFLADLLWRGKYMKADKRKALALIKVAVGNAPDHERIWIEDIYQNIFCGTTSGTRKSATPLVAMWKKLYGRVAPQRQDRMGLGLSGPAPQRTCSNGEPVTPVERHGADGQNAPVIAKRTVKPPQTMQGSMGGFSLRDAGATAPER